jgi:hypothetical protein
MEATAPSLSTQIPTSRRRSSWFNDSHGDQIIAFPSRREHGFFPLGRSAGLGGCASVAQQPRAVVGQWANDSGTGIRATRSGRTPAPDRRASLRIGFSPVRIRSGRTGIRTGDEATLRFRTRPRRGLRRDYDACSVRSRHDRAARLVSRASRWITTGRRLLTMPDHLLAPVSRTYGFADHWHRDLRDRHAAKPAPRLVAGSAPATGMNRSGSRGNALFVMRQFPAKHRNPRTEQGHQRDGRNHHGGRVARECCSR